MKKNPWPYAIIIYFAVFITAMTTWIVFAVRNDHQLVRKDYYEQELKYQSELDSQARAANIDVFVTYDSTRQILTVAVPGTPTKGALHFYRPADAKLDCEVPLALTSGVQTIDLAAFEPGLWKVRLVWTDGGVAYRRDTSLTLAPTKLSSL